MFSNPPLISLYPTRAVISSLGRFSSCLPLSVYLSTQATRLMVYARVLFPVPRLPLEIDREMQSTQLITADLEVRTRSRASLGKPPPHHDQSYSDGLLTNDTISLVLNGMIGVIRSWQASIPFFHQRGRTCGVARPLYTYLRRI
jgi:hypothetical protein